MTARFRTYTAPWWRTETLAQKHARALLLLRKLRAAHPGSKIMLNYTTPMQLLVAVMLSAQCTDKQVNKVTASLFKKYKTTADFAAAKQSVFEKEIFGTGFYRNKARNVIAAAKIIEKKHGGAVPDTMEELVSLPGVARKTANIVLINAFNKSVGIPVDTHVSRIAQRLALTDTDNTSKIETDLMDTYPKRSWARLSYYFIEHGRAHCTAQRPKCATCPIKKYCPSATAKTT